MTEIEIFTCDQCMDKKHCAFYEPGAEECPYEAMMPRDEDRPK